MTVAMPGPEAKAPYTPPRPKRYIARDKDGNVVGTGAELRRVPVPDVKIDSDYQRDVSSHWVSEHKPFDPQRASVLVLSSRLGGPYCIDGGHRLALARESDVHHVNAFVIDGLTKRDEARLFTQHQRDRRNLTSFALYRADLVAGNPDTHAIVRIVNNAGFQLAKTTGPLHITAIDAVRFVFRYGGDDLLARTLELIKRIWFDEDKALSGQIIKGLALFLASAGQQPTFQRERLERVMRAAAPLKLIRLSQAVAEKRSAASTTPANIAEVLQESYEKLRGKDEPPLSPLTIGGKRRSVPRAGS